MTKHVTHDLRIEPTSDELARQDFMSNMRTYVLHDLANGMRSLYDKKVEPAFKRKKKRAPKDGVEVHKALKDETYFKFYSSMRCNTQEMVFRSVIPTVERNQQELKTKAKAFSKSTRKAKGTLNIPKGFVVPRSVSALDVHLMPGNYDTEYGKDDVVQGAIYDNGISVFSMGFFGDRLDDIGRSIAMFIKTRYPKFNPERILDMGCTVGHNTLPWAEAFPDAETHGIDAGAPVVRYAHGRAQAEGTTVHFHQGDAEDPGFEDESFDLIFSSMFLHEVSPKGIPKVFKHAHRLLKPGGLMLHMELPPNSDLPAYERFYLDWDSYYNKEPFYKSFRDSDLVAVCREAGFKKKDFVQFVVPSIQGAGVKTVKVAARAGKSKADSDTGRFRKGVTWFCFGAWK